MIEPTEDDIGRRVIYTGNRYPGGLPELGVITSFNEHCVFVSYSLGSGGTATLREDLEWEHPCR